MPADTRTRRADAAIERDRRWFQAHPGRRSYCRLAGELEEQELRDMHRVTRQGLPLIAVRNVAPGVRLRRLHIVPALCGRELVIPAGEAECSAIFETERLEISRTAAGGLAVHGDPERKHLPTLQRLRSLEDALRRDR